MRSSKEVYTARLECGLKARALRKLLYQLAPNLAWDQAREILQRKEIEDRALTIAAKAREIAQSWRGFDVGTLVIGIRQNCRPWENPWSVRPYANTREVDEKDVKKKCGEIRGMENATKTVVLIVAFFVVGEPQEDHGSGVMSKTLTPCEICRPQMRAGIVAKPQTVRQDTLVTTAHFQDLDIRDHYTVVTLHAHHNENHLIIELGRVA